MDRRERGCAGWHIMKGMSVHCPTRSCSWEMCCLRVYVCHVIVASIHARVCYVAYHGIKLGDDKILVVRICYEEAESLRVLPG